MANKKKIVKTILIVIVSSIVIFFAYTGIRLYSEGYFKTSSKEELVRNYQSKEKQILRLKQYFNSIVPKNFNVFVEFESDNNITMRVSEKSKYQKNPTLWFEQYNFDPYKFRVPKSSLGSKVYTPKLDSLTSIERKLNWAENTFRQIKTLLDSAKCISIENGDPSEIGFARMGEGEYMYLLFDEPISDSLKKNYNNGCNYSYFNNKLILEWAPGVIGQQCFPDK